MGRQKISGSGKKPLLDGEVIYELAITELSEKYFKDGAFKVNKDIKDIGYVPAPHEAYMSFSLQEDFEQPTREPDIYVIKGK